MTDLICFQSIPFFTLILTILTIYFLNFAWVIIFITQINILSNIPIPAIISIFPLISLFLVVIYILKRSRKIIERSELRQINASELDDNVINLVFEQYKLCNEIFLQVFESRSKINQFYITILSGLIVAVSAIIGFQSSSDFRNQIEFSFGFTGIIICALWYYHIEVIKIRQVVKLQVIHDIERFLPYPSLLSEAEYYADVSARFKLISNVNIEQAIAILLAVPFLILSAYSLLSIAGIS